MSRIKYTVVPKENLEACIFESGVRLSEADIIIDPIIVFNANMELGIETEIYGEDMNESNFRFTKESNLLNLLTEVNDAELTNTIIVNGFDLDLDYVRNNIVKLAEKSDKIFSINSISDKRKYTGFTINFDSKELKSMTDEEWEKYKKEYNKEFEDSLSKDVERNKVIRPDDEDAEKAVAELLKSILGITDDDIQKEDDGMLTVEIKDNNNLPAPCNYKGEKDDYEAYSYANNTGMITIEKDDGKLIFMDEENEVIFPEDFLQFIIDTLKKLK